jgi:hypothetical protein
MQSAWKRCRHESNVPMSHDISSVHMQQTSSSPPSDDMPTRDNENRTQEGDFDRCGYWREFTAVIVPNRYTRVKHSYQAQSCCCWCEKPRGSLCTSRPHEQAAAARPAHGVRVSSLRAACVDLREEGALLRGLALGRGWRGVPQRGSAGACGPR